MLEALELYTLGNISAQTDPMYRRSYALSSLDLGNLCEIIDAEFKREGESAAQGL